VAAILRRFSAAGHRLELTHARQKLHPFFNSLWRVDPDYTFCRVMFMQMADSILEKLTKDTLPVIIATKNRLVDARTRARRRE
jgi:hypothetical protein